MIFINYVLSLDSIKMIKVKNDKYHIKDNEKLTPFQNITDAIIGYREYLYDKKY